MLVCLFLLLFAVRDGEKEGGSVQYLERDWALTSYQKRVALCSIRSPTLLTPLLVGGSWADEATESGVLQWGGSSGTVCSRLDGCNGRE